MQLKMSMQSSFLCQTLHPCRITLLILLSALLSGCEELPENEKECTIVRITDGDTVTVQCAGRPENTRVRLYCIDAPESKQKPWGEESRDNLRALIGSSGGTVRLVEINKDRYGRTVGEIYKGEKNINLAQIKDGQAAVYEAFCKKPEYGVAEREAKRSRKGIWSKPGSQQTPWEWRKQRAEEEAG